MLTKLVSINIAKRHRLMMLGCTARVHDDPRLVLVLLLASVMLDFSALSVSVHDRRRLVAGAVARFLSDAFKATALGFASCPVASMSVKF